MTSKPQENTRKRKCNAEIELVDIVWEQPDDQKKVQKLETKPEKNGCSSSDEESKVKNRWRVKFIDKKNPDELEQEELWEIWSTDGQEDNDEMKEWRKERQALLEERKKDARNWKLIHPEFDGSPTLNDMGVYDFCTNAALKNYDFTPNEDYCKFLDETEMKTHLIRREQRRMKEKYEKIERTTFNFPKNIQQYKSINEYWRHNVISEGSYGKVYLGEVRATKEKVAMKKYKFKGDHMPFSSQIELEMFQKVGRNRNIVNAIEMVVGPGQQHIYLVMELMDCDLRTLIDNLKKQKKRFSTSQQKMLMRQLLSGVEHIHKRKIIHRDLKTANILINSHGQLKITDFGISCEYTEQREMNRSVVTLWYRPPELLLGLKHYWYYIDMWSVGCIMAEIILMKAFLTGEDEKDQIKLIFKWFGTPCLTMWPEFMYLPKPPVPYKVYPPGEFKKKFLRKNRLDHFGFDLIEKLLKIRPLGRITASDAVNHSWFTTNPLPSEEGSLPILPIKNETTTPNLPITLQQLNNSDAGNNEPTLQTSNIF